MASITMLDSPTHDINILLNRIYSLAIAIRKIGLWHLLATPGLFILNCLPILYN